MLAVAAVVSTDEKPVVVEHEALAGTTPPLVGQDCTVLILARYAYPDTTDRPSWRPPTEFEEHDELGGRFPPPVSGHEYTTLWPDT